MKVARWARESMLSKLLEKLAYSFVTGVGKVEFFTSSGDPICELEFSSTELNQIGDNAVLIFKSIDGSKVLKGFSVLAGTPSTFKILGREESGDPDSDAITGTVGSFNSKADLKFGNINWVVDTYITITDFGIELPNGL